MCAAAVAAALRRRCSARDDANSTHCRDVDGNVWYADMFLYPNHWRQGSNSNRCNNTDNNVDDVLCRLRRPPAAVVLPECAQYVAAATAPPWLLVWWRRTAPRAQQLLVRLLRAIVACALVCGLLWLLLVAPSQPPSSSSSSLPSSRTTSPPHDVVTTTLLNAASEVEQRRRELLARVTRKRAEVCAFLDTLFYSRCRSILREVRALDERQTFATNPSALPDYTQYVRRPMYLGLIEKRLTQYDYASAGEFIADMRLVVDNCYAYNGQHSPFSATARAMELRMEDLFVRELGAAPPHMNELHRLGTQLPKATSAAVWRVITLYEGTPGQPVGTRVHVHPAKFHCATQRRILAVLRRAAASREEAAAVVNNNNNNNTATATMARQPLLPPSAKASGGGGATRPGTRRSAPSPTRMAYNNNSHVAHTRHDGDDDEGDDEGDDEVHFHTLAGNDVATTRTTAANSNNNAAAAAAAVAAAAPTTTTLLERVPQNTRTAHSHVHQVSPVHLPDEFASVFADDDDNAAVAHDANNNNNVVVAATLAPAAVVADAVAGTTTMTAEGQAVHPVAPVAAVTETTTAAADAATEAKPLP